MKTSDNGTSLLQDENKISFVLKKCFSYCDWTGSVGSGSRLCSLGGGFGVAPWFNRGGGLTYEPLNVTSSQAFTAYLRISQSRERVSVAYS